jgi:hypothetical protein
MTDPPPHDHTPASPLVGRDREQATLRERLAAALAGRGGLVLVGGVHGAEQRHVPEAIGAGQPGYLAVGGHHPLRCRCRSTGSTALTTTAGT